MRINIYSEEITGDVQLIAKEGVIGADGQLTTFYGVRIFLASPDDLHRTGHDQGVRIFLASLDDLHRTEHDDDRSAVTFWYRNDDDDAARLRRLLGVAADLSHPWPAKKAGE